MCNHSCRKIRWNTNFLAFKYTTWKNRQEYVLHTVCNYLSLPISKRKSCILRYILKIDLPPLSYLLWSYLLWGCALEDCKSWLSYLTKQQQVRLKWHLKIYLLPNTSIWWENTIKRSNVNLWFLNSICTVWKLTKEILCRYLASIDFKIKMTLCDMIVSLFMSLDEKSSRGVIRHMELNFIQSFCVT